MAKGVFTVSQKGFCLAVFSFMILSACKGSTGPEGLLSPGIVSGKVTVWEDALFNSGNAPANIPAGGFTVTLSGDSTRSTTTGPDGSYALTDVPAGTYIIETSRQADSPTGYGTMKRYNFVVGGGTAFHSGDIGRNAPQPTSVSSVRDSVAGTSGANIAGIRVAWTIAPPSLQFTTFSYLLTFTSPSVSATVSVLGTGALSDTTIVVGLPPESYAVAVQADIGFGYIDESSGDTVFPTRSAAGFAPTNVVLTRPTVLDISPKSMAREFPNKKVVAAQIN
ncbi:MAG: hypothetical protein HOH43_03255 [Candidatus Latescibacteria bacterium]|nr:hypothetical protein [Candidatus Latescibacterota bacterium]